MIFTVFVFQVFKNYKLSKENKYMGELYAAQLTEDEYLTFLKRFDVWLC